jgi:hypothetical protein
MTGKKPSPSVSELEAALTQAERRLLAAQRANSTARTTRPALLAQGNDIATADNRREISATEQRIRENTEEVEFARQAIETTKARDHAAFESQRLRNLEKLGAAMVSASTALEEITAQWAAARGAAHEAAVEFETELSRCNIPYDAFLSAATRLDGRVEMLLWAVTEGAFGRSRSLDSPSQLRESGRASLKLAAKEFRSVVLRTARLQLNVTDQPNGNEAA